MTTENNTKIFDKITAVISQEFGKIGLYDLWVLSTCYDELWQARSKKRDEMNAIYQSKQIKESELTLGLKEDKDENGKKKYTETQIEGLVVTNPGIQKMQTDNNVIRFALDTIEGKIKALEVMMTTIRMNLKREGPMTYQDTMSNTNDLDEQRAYDMKF